MSKTRVTLDLDNEAEERLRALSERRKQEQAGVISDALALLDSFDDLDIEEDLRRLQAFEQDQEGIMLEDVEAWVRSWGTSGELQPPSPRKLG